MSSPVTTNTVIETAVIPAPLTKVWSLIRLGEFASWWSALESSGAAKSSSEVDVFEWTFKDKTTLTVKQEEHSSLRHSISYSVLTAEPALSYSSVISTITLHAITSGASAGQTFIEWSGQFSSDADASVVSDAKFKRQDAFEDLVKAVKA